MTLKKNKRTRKKRGGTPPIHAHRRKTTTSKPKTLSDGFKANNEKFKEKERKIKKEIYDLKYDIRKKFCQFCSRSRDDIIGFNEYYYEANDVGNQREDDNNLYLFFDFKKHMLLNNKQHKWMTFLKDNNRSILSRYKKWKAYYDGDTPLLVDAENKKNLEDWVQKYTENIIFMKEEFFSRDGGWTLPFIMKIPNANIDAFLGKKTLEQLLKHMENDNEPDNDEKIALKKFYITRKGIKMKKDLEKKSNMRCNFSSFTGCKGKKKRAGKALQIINNLIGTQTSDVEVKVNENHPTAGKGGKRKKRTRRRRKKRTRRRRKRTKKRRKRRR